MGTTTIQSNLYVPPNATAIGVHNGELFVGGGLTSYPRGMYQYNSTSNNFVGQQAFVSSVSNTEFVDVVMEQIDNKLYAFGDLRFSNSSFNSVFVLENDGWRSIGALDESASDIAVCQGFVYAIVDGRFKRHLL